MIIKDYETIHQQLSDKFDYEMIASSSTHIIVKIKCEYPRYSSMAIMAKADNNPDDGSWEGR